jgi:hypothetical protein
VRFYAETHLQQSTRGKTIAILDQIAAAGKERFVSRCVILGS